VETGHTLLKQQNKSRGKRDVTEDKKEGKRNSELREGINVKKNKAEEEERSK
jgi:hypothetical protein